MKDEDERFSKSRVEWRNVGAGRYDVSLKLKIKRLRLIFV